MYVCPHDSAINEDVLSILAILSQRPFLVGNPSVEQETGVDEERVLKLRTHVAACGECANVLAECFRLQVALDQGAGSAVV